MTLVAYPLHHAAVAKSSYWGLSSHFTRCGSDCSQRMVSVTPDAMSAQAFSVAERNAACSLLAETVLHAVRPWYTMQASTR